MARYIGIQHRIKQTKQEEARPTKVCIINGDGTEVFFPLEDDIAELDFVLGRYPSQWERVPAGANLDELKQKFPPHHLVWQKLRKNEDPVALGQKHLLKQEKGRCFVLQTPAAYEGFQPGDVVAMSLGGSGDRLAYALSHRGEAIKAEVWRLKPADLKAERARLGRDKTSDSQTLAELMTEKPELFYKTESRDRALILLIELYRVRIDAMKARIGAEQRLYQTFIGRIFCSEDGQYPAGSIELAFKEQKANDKVLQALLLEEAKREKALIKLVELHPVYQAILTQVEGLGPMIAARLLTAIGDIRRFETAAKLKAFLGVHVLSGGKHGERPADKQFARRRHGEVANWHPDGRQALYLLADQWNKRPDSEWGQKLREYKTKLHAKHPEPMPVSVIVDGKPVTVTRYTDGHIHKMASWRTATKFVEWLYREWSKLEKKAAAEPQADAA